MSKGAPKPLGLRREVLILLPAALLLLIVLSVFTLASYRQGIERLTDERRTEALAVGRWLLERTGEGGGGPHAEELHRRVPRAQAVAILDGSGAVLSQSGAPLLGNPLAPLAVAGRVPSEPTARGPAAALPETVAAFLPFETPGGRRVLRLDLPARALAAQRRGLMVLTAVVAGVDAALVLLVLLFLRHLLRPWETLLARAREVGEADDGEEDETALLISTFERGIAALARERGGRPEDDIALLERMLAQSLESGLLILDRGGGVVAVNPVGAALLGIEPPAPGTPLAEVLERHGELCDLLAGAVAGESSLRRREVAVTGAAGSLTLGLSVHPLHRDDGTVRGYLVLFADLTEIQRQAEEARLGESLAQLGELAAGVAHELRNSLATLRGYLALIERRPREGLDEYLADVRHETEHLERVLEDFLSFARPGSARVEEVSPAEVVARAAADPALAGVPIAVRDDGGGRVGLKGDRQLLERAIKNLLRNAAEATREAPALDRRVEVHLRRDEMGVLIAIEDRGPGVPEEVKRRLFQPFASGRPGGVGLGLAISRRIVDLHGGSLRLEDREGGGTRAVLQLPAGRIVTEGNDPPSSPTAGAVP